MRTPLRAHSEQGRPRPAHAYFVEQRTGQALFFYPAAEQLAVWVYVVNLHQLVTALGEAGGRNLDGLCMGQQFAEFARIAVDPKSVAPVGIVDPEDADPEPNRTASRIPTIGVKYVQPKRKNPNLKPDYPSVLRSQGIEADVTLLVYIDETGSVTRVKIVGKVLYPEFGQSARKFALQHKYEPATRDGIPRSDVLNFTVHFRIEDQ